MSISHSEKKALIIGCSFSNGSYETKISGKLGEMPKDDHVSSIGWYDYLELFKDKKIDVYSMPGLGWMAYAHLIRSMRDSGAIRNYDLLIIQETFEPRFCILGNQFVDEFTESKRESDRTLNIQHMCHQGSPAGLVMYCNAHDGVSFYKDFVNKNKDAHSLPPLIANRLLVDIAESQFVRTMLHSSQKLVTDIAREAGIKVLVISFSDPSMQCNDHITQGPVNVIHSVYSGVCLHSRNEYLTDPTKGPETYGGRLTRNGNFLLGNRFNHLLKKFFSY